MIVTVSGRPLCTEQLINHYNWWVVAPFILLFIMAMWCEIAICFIKNSEENIYQIEISLQRI